MNKIMIAIILLLTALAVSDARPNEDVSLQNVITVPPNCPAGQEWVNGQCRDVWRNGVYPANVVTVPPNCPPGQVFVNGQCRDVWFFIEAQLQNSEDIQSQNDEDISESHAVPANVVTVPPNCPDGQVYVNGQCREIWLRKPNLTVLDNTNDIQAQQINILEESVPALDDRNVISVPSQCPAGYKPDALGVCREIFQP